MAAKTKRTAKVAPPEARRSPEEDLRQALSWLKEKSTQHDLDNLERFGIAAKNALGVSMANLRLIAKRLGRSHALAAALWDTECYEARMLAAFVEEPERVTPAQMERWCRDFDNWAICDTVCFHLFDRTPHAWDKVAKWCSRRDEFGKRAGFALLACLAAHDKASTEAQFLAGLKLVEQGAEDERNFVKKGVSWALRSIGNRGASLNAAALAVAGRLAASTEPAARWVGKDALRELKSPATLRRVAARA
ncbi:DNA alkylation repair protein [Myxococcaceae bacterium GXIMD 01537]